jgi:NADPH2:quinone reductase
MKAQVIEGHGGPEEFEEREVERPEVRAGHVLIRVAASSVNPVDTKIRSGAAPLGPELPAVLHGDVAGTVEEAGPGVEAFRPGDEVYACAGGVKGQGGALAEYLLADADLVARKPRTLGMAEAAALPLVTITAWEGLIDRAGVRPGQSVLVHGAAGGVGHIGVQLARIAGARVFATGSSEEKLEIARDLGATAAINYREQSVEEYVAEHTGGEGFDVVFDTIGGENLDRSFQAARPNGTVVSISTSSTHDLSPLHQKGLTLHVVFMLLPMLLGRGRARHGGLLTDAARLVDDGRLRPLLDSRKFSFSEAGEAHRRLESGEAVGKVTLLAEDRG